MKPILFRNKILSLQENMMNFALMLTSNREAAQDLLQETTLKVLDSEAKYIQDLNFKAWVMTIMRNIFVNNYRKVVRSQMIIDQTEDLYLLNLSHNSGFDTPEGLCTLKEINTAINALDPVLRVPFSMFLAGYKYSEISVHLQVSMGTVKSRIFSARKELQNTLRDMK
ncbi:RNA polymerase sigma factor [Bacteroidales bacterium]|nr:RNA polymerase sigma factor [Bacteroidales bacterium]